MNLVKDRKIYVKRGFAFVPRPDMIHVASQAYKEFLRREINVSVKNVLHFYIFISEGIRFVSNLTPPPPVFIKNPGFETP